MCWLSSYETKFHSTSSLTYTSCSSLKTCSMKRLCSDSLVKLMHICGKLLTPKFSKPKMSSTPVEKAGDGSEMYSLITHVHQSKTRL